MEFLFLIHPHVSHDERNEVGHRRPGCRSGRSRLSNGKILCQRKDSGPPLSVAKPFLDLSGHIVCTWMLLKSAVAADSLLSASQTSEMDRAFYQGKILAAQFAVSNLLPQVDALAQTISAWDRSILDIVDEAF
jgi:hypothetical protein